MTLNNSIDDMSSSEGTIALSHYTFTVYDLLFFTLFSSTIENPSRIQITSFPIYQKKTSPNTQEGNRIYLIFNQIAAVPNRSNLEKYRAIHTHFFQTKNLRIESKTQQKDKMVTTYKNKKGKGIRKGKKP